MSGSPKRLFPGVRFAHVVSLGANCEPAHHLRRTGRHTVRGLFDWLVTPLASIASILEDGGARLGRDFISAHDGTSVRCAAYDVLYHHEFPRDAGGLVRFSAELSETCRRKMTYKMASLVQACCEAGPVLFIRFGPGSDLPWDPHAAPEQVVAATDLNALVHAISRRFPSLDFRLLAITTAADAEVRADEPLDARVALRRLPRQEGDGWALSDGDWAGLLGELDFLEAAMPSSGRLDEALHWFGDADPDPEPAPPSSRLPEPALRAMVEAGMELWRSGRAFEAAALLTDVFEHGWREGRFVNDYLSLLTGEARYAEVLERQAQLLAEGQAAGPQRRLLAAHAKLALQRDRVGEIAAASEREQTAAWMSAEQLLGTIELACQARRPFSFVRLGDGEARFLIAAEQSLQAGLTAKEAEIVGELVWFNWFDGSLAAQDGRDMADLLSAYRQAVREADVLGVSDVARLASDTGHYGYLAAQEDWLRRELDGLASGPVYTSALNHYALDQLSPHLARLLEGQPFIGVVSPHPDLAQRLASRFSIPRYASYDIPAEGRLPSADATRRVGPHFPDRYLELIDTLEAPYPGAVFLVAAGLLGKVYCHRIKQLGGVALDIGSLADAWIGFNTRPGQMERTTALPVGDASGPDADDPIVACLSMAKTSSMALTQALRDAGWSQAAHIHYLGPRSLSFKQARLKLQPKAVEPMMDVALQIASRLQSPRRDVTIVSSVRDPIGRLVAQYFASRYISTPSSEIDLEDAERGLLGWFDQRFGREFTTEWLDDNLGTALGLDFRQHAFDHDRRSIRYARDGLRLLLLRQEDHHSGKELELGWLLGRGPVTFPPFNTASGRPYAEAYRTFKKSFVAPRAWLKNFYATDFALHFYTGDERESFAQYWSGGSRRSAG